jgi:hypothetical protein
MRRRILLALVFFALVVIALPAFFVKAARHIAHSY